MKKMNKNLLLLIASLLVGCAAFFYVGETIGWEAVWSSFNIFTKLDGLLIVLISFLIAFISTIRWREILKDQGVKNLSIWEMFKIYLGGFSISYLFPIIILGSEVFRIFAIHEKCNIKLEKAVSSVLAERILEWTINVLVIVIAVFYFFYAIATPSRNIMIIFGISFLIVLVMIVFVYTYILKKKNFVHKIIKNFNKEISEENVAIQTEKEIFKYFNFKNKKLWKGYGLSLLRVSAMLLRVWLIVFFLGAVIGIMPATSILGFSYLSTIIPIPATLGFQELIQSFAFNSLNLENTMATAFAMILRAGDLIVSISGLFLVFSLGVKFLKNKL